MDNRAMFKLGYGLYVLTARDGERDNGCIVNTVMQITSTPNCITVAVNKQNFTHDMIAKTWRFNVSVIDETADFGLFERFGFHSGGEVDKFKDYEPVKRSENGLLYVTKSANAFLSAKVISMVDADTHTLFIAEITDGAVLSDAASATYAFYHSNIKPKPEKTNKKGWRCKICGYIYEGEVLPPDFVCPVCKHPASDFEKIE